MIISNLKLFEKILVEVPNEIRKHLLYKQQNNCCYLSIDFCEIRHTYGSPSRTGLYRVTHDVMSLFYVYIYYVICILNEVQNDNKVML